MESRIKVNLKAKEIVSLLQQRFAILTGGRDRHGRPIVSFPARDSVDKQSIFSTDDLTVVLSYLYAIPSDETKELGFTILIDMRHGTQWNHIKPILKLLEDVFSTYVNTVYIMKPDKFLEKQKAAFASNKYIFDVIIVTIDNLHKYFDLSQLTPDFDGSLHYDHEEWIELRIAVESFLTNVLDSLQWLERIKIELEQDDLPSDPQKAKQMLDDLSNKKRLLSRMTVEQLDLDGQQLIPRLIGANITDEAQSAGGCGDSDYGSACREPQGPNPDFVVLAPRLSSLLESVKSTRQQLFTLLQSRKQKVDQCFQLKLFQQDADKMFDWIRQNVDLYLTNYSDIGDSYDRTKELQSDHQQFARAAKNVEVQVEHLLTVATRLLEGGHFAGADIRLQAEQLQRRWELFTTALDRRHQLLSLAAHFHFKAQAYLKQSEDWLGELQAPPRDLPNSVPELENTISQHQELTECINHSYTEATREGKTVLDALKKPPELVTQVGEASLPLTGPESLNGAGTPIVSSLQQLLSAQRQLEHLWQERRIRLQQRLALLLFEQDVQQVMDWLSNHGELFLRKNTGIGRNLQRARALQKSHQHFQNVAQNTYRNAEKLLSAADELAGLGECEEPARVAALATQLRQRVSGFDQQVQQRRRLLDLSVLFHTHFRELLAWFDDVERDAVQQCAIVGSDLRQCERRMDQWMERANATWEATDTTLREGQQLLSTFRQQRGSQAGSMTSIASSFTDNNSSRVEATSTNSKSDYEAETDSADAIEQLMAEVDRRQSRLRQQWTTQQQQLELSIQFRLFYQDCQMVLGQLVGWCEDMRWLLSSQGLDPSQSDYYISLQQENSLRLQATVKEINVNADAFSSELHQVTGGITLVTEEGKYLSEEITQLVGEIQARQQQALQLSQHVMQKLRQHQDLASLQSTAQKAISWIQQEEQLLAATFALPSSLSEAEQLRKDHDQVQSAILQTHETIVRLQTTASSLLDVEPTRVHKLADEVLGRWRKLCLAAEDRHKLLTAATTYYKTLMQVVPVLERLEADYKRGEDCCTILYQRTSQPRLPRVDFVREHITRLLENKEKFLKGCSFARKNSELFLKYLRRSGQQIQLHLQQQSIVAAHLSSLHQMETSIAAFLDELRPRESRVLELWARRKRQLDHCQQFVLFEASALQLLDWIHKEGETYLASNSAIAAGQSREQTEKLLIEHDMFKIKVKEQRERVRVLCQIQEQLGSQEPSDSAAHSADICKWVNAARQRYSDFAGRMDKRQVQLLNALGKSLPSKSELSLDRRSDPSLEERVVAATSRQIGDKRKSTRKIELIMQELLSSERNYVKDLEDCVTHYLNVMRTSKNLPSDLSGKEATIFSNLQEIYGFHKNVFLHELEKYESLPEDVGHCFIARAENFQNIYVPYCKNKEISNDIVTKHAAFFEQLHHRSGLTLPLPAYLIKPVQRIVKYEQLLEELYKCSQGGELKDAREFMHNVPLRANDILHLGSLSGCTELDTFGDFLLQEAFTVNFPKNAKPMFKKGHNRRVFLFERCIVFSKVVDRKESNSDSSSILPKYLSKEKLMISEIHVTEHVEGDECKFALWPAGPPPKSEDIKTFVKASSREIKEQWVKKVNELRFAQVFRFETSPVILPEIGAAASSAASEENIERPVVGGGGDRTSQLSSASSEQDQPGFNVSKPAELTADFNPNKDTQPKLYSNGGVIKQWFVNTEGNGETSLLRKTGSMRSNVVQNSSDAVGGGIAGGGAVKNRVVVPSISSTSLLSSTASTAIAESKDEDAVQNENNNFGDLPPPMQQTLKTENLRIRNSLAVISNEQLMPVDGEDKKDLVALSVQVVAPAAAGSSKPADFNSPTSSSNSPTGGHNKQLLPSPRSSGLSQQLSAKDRATSNINRSTTVNNGLAAVNTQPQVVVLRRQQKEKLQNLPSSSAASTTAPSSLSPRPREPIVGLDCNNMTTKSPVKQSPRLLDGLRGGLRLAKSNCNDRR